MSTDEQADRVTTKNFGKYLALCERGDDTDTNPDGSQRQPIDMRGLFKPRSDQEAVA